jgi:hypothetical protein
MINHDIFLFKDYTFVFNDYSIKSNDYTIEFNDYTFVPTAICLMIIHF